MNKGEAARSFEIQSDEIQIGPSSWAGENRKCGSGTGEAGHFRSAEAGTKRRAEVEGHPTQYLGEHPPTAASSVGVVLLNRSGEGNSS